MNKFIKALINFVVTIAIIIAFFYWAFAPGPIDISNKEIEKEIEQWIGFDIPSDFDVIKAWDNGYAIGDIYYNYEIQFSPDGFEQFQKNWSKINKDLTLVTGEPSQALYIEIIVQPEDRKLFYYYAND